MAVKTNQRKWRAGLPAAALALLLAGPAVAQELRIGINGDADMLDPTLSRTLTGRVVFAALCDKLVDIDADLNYVPQLATSWKWSEDGKSLTMTLRQGVRFHDGEPFDAAAVVYNLDRHLKLPGSNRRNELGTFSGAEAIDGHTVRLNLSAPFAPLVAVLSDRAGMMVSPKAARELGDKFGNAPVCAGAFKFVRRVAQDRIVLEKFAGYWNAANIHFDGVTYLPIADAAVRVANVRAGSIDIAEAILPSDVAELQRDARIRLATGPSLAVYRIEFNIANGEQAKTPLGQSAKVRQAFELAIDRNVLNQVAFDGQYIPGNQSVPPGGKFYIASLPIPPRDVARARALLKEAGLDRLKFKLLLPNGNEYAQAGQIIQSLAAEAGIDVELTTAEVVTALNRSVKGDFQAFLILWSGRTDIDSYIYMFNACDGSLNANKYCNKEVDHWLDEGRTRLDAEGRYAAYEKAMGLLLRDIPNLYLWHPKLIYAMSEKIDGFKVVPDGITRFPGMRRRP